MVATLVFKYGLDIHAVHFACGGQSLSHTKCGGFVRFRRMNAQLTYHSKVGLARLDDEVSEMRDRETMILKRAQDQRLPFGFTRNARLKHTYHVRHYINHRYIRQQSE